jgi:hypothetical protein
LALVVLVPVSEDSYLITLVLVEIKSVGFSIFQLQEVIIQRLFTDANFFGGFLK